MSEYTINYSVDGWPICKNGEPIFRKKLLLAELQQLQARIEELESINLGLTKTLVEMEAEKAKLVGALEEARHHVVVSPDPVRSGFIQEIEAALDTYRKKGSE